MQLGKNFINSDPSNLKFVIIQTGICINNPPLIVQVLGKTDQAEEEKWWKILRFSWELFFPQVCQCVPSHQATCRPSVTWTYRQVP